MKCPHNSEHTSEHDAQLQALLAGDLPASSGIAAALAACTFCSEQLAVMRQLTASLDAAGAEQRSLLDDSEELLAADRNLVSRAVRTGLASRTSTRRRRPLWPLLLAAAALVLAVIWWSPLGAGKQPAEPPDRLLHAGEAWPKGERIDPEQLLELGFQWQGDEDETFVLLLFVPSDPVDPWHTLQCKGPATRLDRQRLDRMRARGDVWQWQAERTSAATPGSASVALTELHRFAFVH